MYLEFFVTCFYKYRAFFHGSGSRFSDPDPDFCRFGSKLRKKILSGSGSKQKDPNPEHCFFKEMGDVVAHWLRTRLLVQMSHNDPDALQDHCVIKQNKSPGGKMNADSALRRARRFLEPWYRGLRNSVVCLFLIVQMAVCVGEPAVLDVRYSLLFLFQLFFMDQDTIFHNGRNPGSSESQKSSRSYVPYPLHFVLEYISAN